MKIERIVLRNLRAIRSRDDTFGGSPSVCLRGLNGSGKTTYLEAIAQLWQWFRRCTLRQGFATPAADSVLTDAGLVAVLFTELPGPRSRMWVAWGTKELLGEFVIGSPDSAVEVHGDRIRWEPATLMWWTQAFARAESGGEAIPNVVCIEAENKYVPAFRLGELARSVPAPAFAPVARHLPSARGANHLEGIMRTLFLARPERWATLTREFTRLRPNLKLLDRFDATGERPIFQTLEGDTLTVDRLSAGERSVLINLCMILRWLTPGGLVLIDEPELHQHLSLMRGSIAVAEALVDEEFGGQLFAASHATEVWDHFRSSGTLVDLDS